MKTEEKENDLLQPTHSRRYRNRCNLRMGDQGNDFVLKRFRLEENRHFREKENDDLKYEVVQNAAKLQQESQELDQELVLVPLEVSQPIENAVQDTPDGIHGGVAVEAPQEVYLFDDDEQELEEQKQQTIKIELDESLSEQVEPERTPSAKQSTMKIKYPNLNLDDFKRTERSNFSTAELMTPSRIPSVTNFLSHTHKQQKQKENVGKGKTVKFSEEQIQRQQQIRGVVLQADEDEGSSITIVDKRLFAISKLPSGIILRCIIKRSNSFMNLISPEYDLYLANGLKHILSAKKYPMRNRQLFKFSTDPLKFTDQSLLSVMHANSNHNIYWMLEPPRKMGEMDLSFIQLVIGYYRMKQSQQNRRFSVLLPTMNCQYQLAIDFQQSFINFSNFKEEIKVQLNNLQKWSNQSKNSTKNFVLADEGDEEYRYLQMKKESDNVFELTIQHPLSPLQAMAIAMTRFDAELK